jgi:lipopolysaccharide transport system ATP-binding protein
MYFGEWRLILRIWLKRKIMKPILEVRNITKRYAIGGQERYLALRDVLSNPFAAVAKSRALARDKQEFLALDDVSFDVAAGDSVAIIGRNGAGKSTLLKILSKITPPSSGRINCRGRVASLLEVGTGFHTELTGRENIYLNGSILGLRKWEIDKHFDAIVDFSGVERFLDTQLKKYSSGMQLRLAFSVAAFLEPEVLVIDEVLAVGDAEFQKKCLGKMGEVSRSGRTVLFVSHNMAAVQLLCQKSVVLVDGKVAFEGGCKAGIEHYLFNLKQVTGLSLRERMDRRGNGELRFVGFRILNGGGQEIPSAINGEDVQFVFEYEVRPGVLRLEGMSFSVVISNQLNDVVGYLDSKLTGDLLDDSAGNGRIVCRIPNFPLVGGSYYYGIHCEANIQIVDAVYQAGVFNVENGVFFGTGRFPQEGYGAVMIDHSMNNRV